MRWRLFAGGFPYQAQHPPTSRADRTSVSEYTNRVHRSDVHHRRACGGTSVRNSHSRRHLTNLISVLRVLGVRDKRRGTTCGPVNTRNGVRQSVSELGVDCGLNTRFTQVLAVLTSCNRKSVNRDWILSLGCFSPFTDMNSKEVPAACGT